MSAFGQTGLPNAQTLTQKIQSLPPERVAEVVDFVEFLQLRTQQAQVAHQDRAMAHLTSQASEPSFSRVWDNPEDAAYDAL